MKKLLFGVLFVFLLALSAFSAEAALTSLNIGSPVYPTGQTGANPGDTVSFTISLQNTDTLPVVASISSTVPTTTSATISAPTISSITIPASGAGTGSFSILVPSTVSGAYSATLTAKTNDTNTISSAYSFVVNAACHFI